MYLYICKNVPKVLVYMCYIICILVLTVNEHYINISLCMYTCYIYFIFIFQEICSVSIVSAYYSQEFMAVGNTIIALTLYTSPCKTAQADCQIQHLRQRAVLKMFLESHCNCEPPNEVCTWSSRELHNCWHASDYLGILTWVWPSNLLSCPTEDRYVAVHNSNSPWDWWATAILDQYKKRDC